MNVNIDLDRLRAEFPDVEEMADENDWAWEMKNPISQEPTPGSVSFGDRWLGPPVYFLNGREVSKAQYDRVDSVMKLVTSYALRAHHPIPKLPRQLVKLRSPRPEPPFDHGHHEPLR